MWLEEDIIQKGDWENPQQNFASSAVVPKGLWERLGAHPCAGKGRESLGVRVSVGKSVSWLSNIPLYILLSHKKEHDWVIRRDVDGPESVI